MKYDMTMTKKQNEGGITNQGRAVLDKLICLDFVMNRWDGKVIFQRVDKHGRKIKQIKNI